MLVVIIVIRPYRMHPVHRCVVLLPVSHVAWSAYHTLSSVVCVGWMNFAKTAERSKYHLRADLWPKEPRLDGI